MTTIQQLSQLPKTIRDTRTIFDCGNPALNDYLARTASQHEAKNVTRTFCGVKDAVIFGYYSLTNSTVVIEELDPTVAKKYRLPTHQLPVVRLAKLAIDLRFQRQGLGQLLLVDATAKVLNVAESSGCVGLMVDAKDDTAAAFYQAFGFSQALDNPLLCFMPLPEIQALFRS